MHSTLRFMGVASGLAAVASAHTTFTTAFVNDEDLGDGVCVRMPKDGSTATYPIDGVTSEDMVCGRNGLEGQQFVCPADAGSTISFWWREWPDYSNTGSIDSSHMGPCAVYLKQVDDASTASGEGDGWFKIWDEGYDTTAGKWCTEKLIDNDGMLPIQLPDGLKTGDYLVRPELLALHESTKGDPQFYVGCLQLHVTGSSSGTLDVPSEYSVSIPGYVDMDSEGLVWDVWNKDGSGYVTPGPEVYFPSSSAKRSLEERDATTYAAIPDDCLIENGNWCGVEVPSYSSESGCWSSSQDCWDQADTCYSEARPMGYANCDVWSEKCKEIESACSSGDFNGPPNQGVQLERVDADLPGGASLSAWNAGYTGSDSGSVADTPAATSSKTTSGETTETGTTSGSGSSSGGSDDAEETETPDYSDDVNQGIEEDEDTQATPTSSADDSAETPEPTGTTGGDEDSGSGDDDDSSDDGPTEGDLTVSTDGRCGGETGQTCEGSEFGDCCSKKGYCGGTRKHCSCGCQGAFGTCFS